MFIDDLRTYLIGQITSLTTSNTFLADLPKNPDTATAVVDNGGDVQNAYDSVEVQVLHRDIVYSDGDSLMEEVKNLLRFSNSFITVGSTRVEKVRINGRPMYLGRDENRAYVFSLNMTFFIRGV